LPARGGKQQRGSYRARVEADGARNLDAREEVLVSIGRNRGLEDGLASVGVRTDGRNTQEEGLASGNGVIEELDGSLGDNVGGVFPADTPGLLVVEAHDTIKVAVRTGIEQD
jgi:hypothetical protein